jgi:hypothetical protein
MVRILVPFQGGYWLVGIVDWPNRAGLPGVARESCVLSTWNGPAPRQVGRDGSPVGGCASSASTGIDARCGGPDVSDARGWPSMAEEIEWFVGIDWASQSHQVCLIDAHGECLGERAVAHGGAGIEELCDWLIARTGATPEVIGVAIEITHGPVVEALLERGFSVYGINPKQLDRFRDRFTRGRRQR